MTKSFQDYFSDTNKDITWKSAQAVVALTEEGATVPFIARYRKEKTGNLDEVQVRQVIDAHATYNEIIKRQSFLVKEIDQQGNLTNELKQRILASFDLAELEEIYRPFKKKKKTKATLAREAGLEPLADWIWQVGNGSIQDTTTLEVKAKEYRNSEKGFVTYDQALKGAQDILIERLANDAELRQRVKDDYLKHGKVSSKKAKKYKAHSKYSMYAEFEDTVANLLQTKKSHRYLAMRRGWQEGELTVSMRGNDEELVATFERVACSVPTSQAADFLHKTAKLAFSGHVVPSVTNEIHRMLKQQADSDAIHVFAENVRKVLMGSPYGPRCVLGLDPGLRTGCKVALVDKGGNFISQTVLHIQGENAENKAKELFGEVTKQIKIDAVAVGNGTGGRETESFLRKIFKELELDTPVVMVNESGASVYSASDVAREEFPDLDLTVRGAISIARRLQDPLAELVKIEPKSIGVGQYQHDVSQSALKKSLHEVVESCVNQVGVDVNTASTALLQYVAGIGPAIARNIVEFRSKNGLFEEREQFLKVSQFTSKAYEQAAGFLRVKSGRNVLDNTGIHPERYSAVHDMAAAVNTKVSELLGDGVNKLLEQKEKWEELVGPYTFADIVVELKKPGRDPRESFKAFSFREDIHEVKDLEEGMICPGLVTNVTNFGAFVDVGVHQDGLVHISELAHQFVDDPRKVVNPGDQVKVKVLAVDSEKNQISFSMKLTEKPPVGKKKASSRQNAKNKAGAGAKAGDRKAALNKDNRKPRRPAKKTGKGGPGQKGPSRPRRHQTPFNNPFAAALSDVSVKK